VNEAQQQAWQRRADQARGEPMRIVTVHDPDAAVLRAKAKPVRHVNRAVRELLERMRVTMYRNQGVGLAAPQVGVSQRLIVVDAGDRYCELVNPEIVHAEGSQLEPMEGCLSIPDLVGEVERAERIRVRGLDAYGRPVRLDAQGYFARVLQHEIDHLDGILFTDRARRVVRRGPETKLQVVFFGSAEFGAEVLRQLLQADVVPGLVVTRPDRPAGRGLALRPTPVRRAAEEAGLRVLTPESARDRGLAEALSELQPDVLVAAAYGLIIPERLLSLPRLGALNVHPSLLPRHRGPDPIRRALWEGDERTGVTVLRMSREVDAGAILGQEEVPVGPEDDAETLAARLAAVGGRLLVRVLRDLATGRAVERPQDPAQATYAPKIAREEEVLDWSLPAATLANRVRALAPRPGLRTPAGLKILRAVAVEEPAAGPPGTVAAARGELVVETGRGRLRILRVQPPDGRPMSAADYLNGHRLRVGDPLP
jgi:methionyl-tRNA formyltransferase